MSAPKQQCRSLQQDPTHVGERSLPQIIREIERQKKCRDKAFDGHISPALHGGCELKLELAARGLESHLSIVWVDRNTILDFHAI